MSNTTLTVPAFVPTPDSQAFLAKARREHRLGAPVSPVEDPEYMRGLVLRTADRLNSEGTPGDTWSQAFVEAERMVRDEAFCLGGCLAEQEEWKAALTYAVLWTPRWDGPLDENGRYDQGARLLK